MRASLRAEIDDRRHFSRDIWLIAALMLLLGLTGLLDAQETVNYLVYALLGHAVLVHGCGIRDLEIGVGICITARNAIVITLVYWVFDFVDASFLGYIAFWALLVLFLWAWFNA